jgi:hypothetical protein
MITAAATSSADTGSPARATSAAKITIDAAGAVVDTDWASTDQPVSCRRPRGRCGDTTG